MNGVHPGDFYWMEAANKGEAERWLRLAATALKDGDLEKAQRFAAKSLSLCFTQQAQGKFSMHL